MGSIGPGEGDAGRRIESVQANEQNAELMIVSFHAATGIFLHVTVIVEG